MSISQTLPHRPTASEILAALHDLQQSAEASGLESLSQDLSVAHSAITLKKPEYLKNISENIEDAEIEEVQKLPIHSIDQLQADYREFANQVHQTRFSFSQWLPAIKLRPLVPGELAIVVADTGVGKSAFISNWAAQSTPMLCLKFELELPRTLLFERYLTMDTGMDGEDVFNAFHAKKEPDWNIQKYRHIFTCDKAGILPDEIERIIVKSPGKIRGKPTMVFVDYIGLIGGKGGTRYDKVSNAIEQFKVVAKNTNTIFVVAAQVSRPDDKETQKDPKLHSAKDSGSIENSGGLVFGLSRDPAFPHLLKIKVLKSTKGGAGQLCTMKFNFPSTLIEPITAEVATNPNWRNANADAN